MSEYSQEQIQEQMQEQTQEQMQVKIQEQTEEQMEKQMEEQMEEQNKQLLNEVDIQIIEERNRDIQLLANDVSIISELFYSVQHLIWEQGIDLNVAYRNTEESVINTTEGTANLEAIQNQSEHTRKLREAGIIMGGTAVGSIGWIGGPWIGIPTTGLGLGISSGIVFIMRKIGV